MQLHIESPHFEPDEKLMELVRSRFEHFAKRYDRIGDCSVVLRKEQSDVQKCSMVVPHHGGDQKLDGIVTETAARRFA